jgi:hypothetical protein
MTFEVERIEAGDAAALDERLRAGEAPFIIARSVGRREREEVWSVAALRARAGSRTVSVNRTETERFDLDDEGRQRFTIADMTLDEALDCVERGGAPGPCFYLRRAALEDLGLPDEGLPGAFLRTRGERRTQNLWVGSRGSLTMLHYDAKNNFLTEMHGTKEVTLFPPTRQAEMYPHELSRPTFFYSRVDPADVDRERFPLFPEKPGVSFELAPGETLYIPPFWWHRIRSRELSVSVNVFWWVRPEQCLVPNSVDYLRLRYRAQGLDEFFADEEEATRALHFARLAEDARERGLNCAATLFCGAATQFALRALGREGVGEEESRRARLCLFLADYAALHGKSPRAEELESLVAHARALASRHLTTWTDELSPRTGDGAARARP